MIVTERGDITKSVKIWGVGGGWFRADNTVLLLIDNIKYRLIIYIIFVTIELKS